jgi:hypothetical protein
MSSQPTADAAGASFRAPAGSAGLGGPGGADRIQRAGLAGPAAVLPVRAVHLHDPAPAAVMWRARPAP